MKKMFDNVRTVCYPSNMSNTLDGLTHGQLKDLQSNGRKNRIKKQLKEFKQMTPTQTTPTQTTNDVTTKRVTKSVFDLTEFDNKQLGKEVVMPKKPKTINEALAFLNNDTQKLLQVIYEGLCTDAVESARSQMEGFKIIDEEGKLGEDYSGKYADDEKGALINAAVLSLAKIQGYDKNKTPEEKRALKEKAREFLRKNPAMIESLQG